ncbi:zinc-dependent metalloprotease [Pelomonas sp. UHG3]|uniref:Zinc-dependent metalloprotease n=1 Tax=Roseateles hydrophilus TaxID=2975054 RepID=A0ACC6CEI7_9BURK|nr:zinc-dependent metalloprotease [Pelomonas sp. UHG3]MCY4746744.1 zinc-dependent metalloprotease [Pelomonas sp. UHG3]
MQKDHRGRARLALLTLTLAAGQAWAQTPPVPPAGAASAAAAAGARPPVVLPDPSEPKPFDKVITSDAKTQQGLFAVHRVKAKLYFEIPKALLDQPLLMVANATAVPAGQDHVGRALHQDVLRFVLHQNRVLVQRVSHSAVTAPGNVMADAVAQSQREAILAVFPVEAFGKGGAPVIEVTRLFASEFGDFSARSVVRGSADASRSYVDSTKAFAGSVRVDAVQTYSVAPTPVPAAPGVPVLVAGPAPRSVSVNVAYNIVRLPEQPMQPRLLDDRVGFFSVSRMDFGAGLQEARQQRVITRWRLEKKDPAAALSEPVKPIVWYIDKATPTALVPFVKKGIEAWNIAFEAAGFKNAVQARPYPTAEEDPEFDPEDVRYSVIRWVPSPIPNAYGPHLADPRSGEILNANIVMYHNILQLQQDWYVTQVGPLDPRARKLPLPDDLMGELVAYVVTHEVGHSLGFPHNMKASSQYPVSKLRDAEWLKTMGHVPTLMDYSRFNYLVQPEDKLDPALLIPKIGPYDIFATRWGYTPIPSAKTPEDERQQLNLWAREQEAKPWLRFNAPKAEGGDVGENTEAVGDADAVTATGLGLANLQRVMKMLPAAVPQDGGDDQLLLRLYQATWQQWAREMGHVVAVVGGYEVQNKHNDQPGAIAKPVPRAQQARAMAFLTRHVLATPDWLLDPAITQRLSPYAAGTLLTLQQRSLLRQLLAPARTLRLVTQEATLGSGAYRLQDLLADLRRGAFGELDGAAAISAPRRSLQRALVETLTSRLSARNLLGSDDGEALIRAELVDLQRVLAAAASRGDMGRRAHLAALGDGIAKALDPRFASAAIALPVVVPVFGHEASEPAQPHACWPGHAH